VGPFGAVPSPQSPATDSWLSIEYQVAALVQLPTTAFQPGGPERTIFAIEAVSFAQSDADISIMAQGAFLDSAATGTVTYQLVDGTEATVPVTPDPSNPAQNPTGALGWLDLTTQNVYSVFRLAATYASGQLAFANTSGSPVTYQLGTYHAANAFSGATYANPAALTIPSSAIAGTGGTVIGVTPGPAFTIIATQSAHGLAVGQVAYLAIPLTSGISGLASTFGLVTAVTATTLQVQAQSSGTWLSGGTVYLCTLAQMQADLAGRGSNAAPGQVTTAITQNASVKISNVAGWGGSNWESNVVLAARTRLSLAAASPNGPAQAYEYFAETAQQILAGLSPSNPIPPSLSVYLFTNGSVQATVYAPVATGIVTIVVASATPTSSVLGANVTPGCAQLAIAGISNASPCVITCGGSHGLLPSGPNTAILSNGILGTLGVAGTWPATVLSPTTFSIPFDSTLAGAWTGGGTVEGGDLGEIDALIQASCTPDGDVSITVSAIAQPIAIVATVAVPAAMVSTYQLAVVTQLQAQIDSYPIGGDAPGFSVAYDDIVGALEEAGVLTLGSASYVRAITALSINGGGFGVGQLLGSTSQAILTPPVIAVVGV
jgi:hypothetical protein